MRLSGPAGGQHRVRLCLTWACSASWMPLCQSLASCTGVTEAWKEGAGSEPTRP